MTLFHPCCSYRRPDSSVHCWLLTLRSLNRFGGVSHPGRVWTIFCDFVTPTSWTNCWRFFWNRFKKHRGKNFSARTAVVPLQSPVRHRTVLFARKKRYCRRTFSDSSDAKRLLRCNRWLFWRHWRNDDHGDRFERRWRRDPLRKWTF